MHFENALSGTCSAAGRMQKKKRNEHSSQTQKLRVNGCVVCCQCGVRIGGLKNMPWQMEWRRMGTVVQSASLGMLQFSLFTK